MIETRQLRVAMQREGIIESYLFAKFEKGKRKGSNISRNHIALADLKGVRIPCTICAISLIPETCVKKHSKLNPLFKFIRL